MRARGASLRSRKRHAVSESDRMDRKLDDSVRQLVDEIEREIGEDETRRHSRIDCFGHRRRRRSQRRPQRGSWSRSSRQCARSSSRWARIPIAQGLRDTPSRVRRMYARADCRLPRRPRAPRQQRDLRRRLQRDGRRQGHPVLQPVRAPSPAVLRPGVSRLHPRRASDRAVARSRASSRCTRADYKCRSA